MKAFLHIYLEKDVLSTQREKERSMKDLEVFFNLIAGRQFYEYLLRNMSALLRKGKLTTIKNATK